MISYMFVEPSIGVTEVVFFLCFRVKSSSFSLITCSYYSSVSRSLNLRPMSLYLCCFSLFMVIISIEALPH